MTGSAVRLWQLISPTLPVGAYSYSQALEHVVDSGEVNDEVSVRHWTLGLLGNGVAYLDLPILLRVHAAWTAGDTAAAARWSRRLEAMRETSELRLEDLAMGGALVDLLVKLGAAVPGRHIPFAAAFAAGAVHWNIAAEDACAGYAWSWCEAQIAAAIKLVPLGHTAGQRVLLALGEAIPSAVAAALACRDDDIGRSLPGFAIASALHETQYTRLFRS